MRQRTIASGRGQDILADERQPEVDLVRDICHRWHDEFL